MSGRRDAPDPVALARVIERFVGEPVEVGGLRRCSGGRRARPGRSTRPTRAARSTRSCCAAIRPGRPTPRTAPRSTPWCRGRPARRAGAARPRVARADDELGAGFLMDRVEGETIPRRILRDDEFADARAAARRRRPATIAARIHAVDPTRCPPLAGAWTPRQQIDQQRVVPRRVRRAAPGARARAALARRARARRAATHPRSCTATFATATSSSAPTASAPSSTGSSRTSATRSRTSAGCA